MLEYDFVALDVETANEEFWSVCQAGLAFFKDSKLVDSWETLVNPGTYFDDINIEIHGITENKVKNAIKISDFYPLLSSKLNGQIIVHHTAFDKVSLTQMAKEFLLPPITCTWVDSSRVARRTWDEVKYCGYGLNNLAKIKNIIQEKPHDALDDAKTAGYIFLKAIEDSKKTFPEWIENSRHNYSLWGTTERAFRDLANSEPNPNGILFGETLVFTGALSISRMEAAQIAYKLGCNIDERVTKNTTILVLGDQDTRKLAGYEKSSKHRKAEELFLQGQPIKIIGEKDFSALVNL